MKKIGLLLPWLVLFLFVLAYKQQIPLVQELHLSTFDIYQKYYPRKDGDMPVYVIDIDEKSLAEVGQWPWPRNVLAELVEKTFSFGAKSLGLDMVFPERDGKSPEVVAQYWPQNEDLSKSLSQLPSHDDLFAKTLAKYPVVKGMVAVFNGVDTSTPTTMPAHILVQSKNNMKDSLISGQIVARNIETIEEASDYNGYFGYFVDHNSSTVRKVPLLFQQDGKVFPALSMETARLYYEADGYHLNVGHDGLNTVKINGFEAIPVSRNGKYHVYYRQYNKKRYISAVDVLKGRANAKVLDAKAVLLGVSAAGLFDMRSTPIDPIVPGVETHAQIIENILMGTHIYRPENALNMEMLMITVLGVLLIVIVQRVGAFSAFATFIILNLYVIALCFYQFKSNGLLYDWSYATLTLFSLFLIQSLAKYAQEKASRLAIRSAFSHYLSPDMVKIVSKDPSKLALGGEEKEISVLFSDIRGFTQMSENLTPRQLTRIMNRYLTPMTEVVQQNKGTIDKYMGDAVMAFWNAPLNVENHAFYACKAALEMLSSLDHLNVSLKEEGLPEISIGIGINTDIVTVGNMGSDQRFDYTIMGDGVNLGARLEGQCKTYGVPLIISEATLSKLGDVSAMPLDKVAVKGKLAGVKLYHLISLEKPTGEIAEKIDLVKRAVSAYQAQEWPSAEELFKNDSVPATLSKIYIDRILVLQKKRRHDDVWDGVYRATSK
ncbi:MAG: adenylate cyclase [Alphaproteobacteria bacterium]